MTWRCFTVRGVPKAQPRPKAYRRGDRAGVYDPGTADGWKDAIALAGARLATVIEGPIRVLLVFNLPRPKRLMRKKDPIGCVAHTSKPDADNLAKAVLDAMTDCGWWQDEQITDLRVVKRYHGKGGWPGATVVVWWSALDH